MKSTIFQWIVLLAIIGIIVAYAYHPFNIHISLPELSSFQIVFYSLCLAFMWVEVLKWGVTKPFNCVKCMTAWISLIIGCTQIGWHGIVYLPIGLFVGAMFEAVKMRWL